jgi:hypothetical protein
MRASKNNKYINNNNSDTDNNIDSDLQKKDCVVLRFMKWQSFQFYMLQKDCQDYIDIAWCHFFNISSLFMPNNMQIFHNYRFQRHIQSCHIFHGI